MKKLVFKEENTVTIDSPVLGKYKAIIVITEGSIEVSIINGEPSNNGSISVNMITISENNINCDLSFFGAKDTEEGRKSYFVQKATEASKHPKLINIFLIEKTEDIMKNLGTL